MNLTRKNQANILNPSASETKSIIVAPGLYFYFNKLFWALPLTTRDRRRSTLVGGAEPGSDQVIHHIGFNDARATRIRNPLTGTGDEPDLGHTGSLRIQMDCLRRFLPLGVSIEEYPLDIQAHDYAVGPLPVVLSTDIGPCMGGAGVAEPPLSREKM